MPARTLGVHRAGGMRAGIVASLLDAVGWDVVAVDDSFATAVAIGLTVQATTAALIIIILTSVTGLTGHARAGRVRWRTGLLFAASGLPVAAAAGALSSAVPGAILTAAFTCLAGVAAWSMLSAHGEEEAAREVSAGKSAAAGAGLGAATGPLGVGGGFLAVPAWSLLEQSFGPPPK